MLRRGGCDVLGIAHEWYQNENRICLRNYMIDRNLRDNDAPEALFCLLFSGLSL